MCMLILNSHHLPDTHKRNVRVKILCVLNKPPRRYGIWGVKEYLLLAFIPTEKEKNSQSIYCKTQCTFRRHNNSCVDGKYIVLYNK